MKVYRFEDTLVNENSLLEAFKLEDKDKIITFVGAGGKTSLINRLSTELMLQGKTVILTTTTRIFENPNIKTLHSFAPSYLGLHLDNVQLKKIKPLANKEDLILKIKEALELEGRIIVGESVPGGKLGPSKLITIQELAQLCDYLLIEGDGARMLPVKAPGANEPVIPQETQLVVGVVGLDAISKKIQDIAFRPETLSTLLSVDVATPLTPALIAQLIVAPQGQQKQVENRGFICVLNKGDSSQDLAQGIEISKILRSNQIPTLITTFRALPKQI